MIRFFSILLFGGLITFSALAQSCCQSAPKTIDLFNQIVSCFYDPQSGHTTPYVAGTCEPKTIPARPSQSTEALVIDLQQVDCTTFVEYVTAARLAGLTTLNSEDPKLQQAVEMLRYRSGIRGNYATRKHYFMEWIKEGEEMGLMTDVSRQLSGAKTLTRKIDFMSAHPQYYPQLSDAAILSAIEQVERELSQETVYYVPVAQLSSALKGMKHGDIVAFVTDKTGLDVQHVGFVYDPDNSGMPRLLHASSSKGEITVSDGTIADYAKSVKHVMGVRVIRLTNRHCHGSCSTCRRQ